MCIHIHFHWQSSILVVSPPSTDVSADLTPGYLILQPVERCRAKQGHRGHYSRAQQGDLSLCFLLFWVLWYKSESKNSLPDFIKSLCRDWLGWKEDTAATVDGNHESPVLNPPGALVRGLGEEGPATTSLVIYCHICFMQFCWLHHTFCWIHIQFCCSPCNFASYTSQFLYAHFYTCE